MRGVLRPLREKIISVMKIFLHPLANHPMVLRIMATCFLLLLGVATPGSAQITIDNTVFPVVGDTLHFAIGNQPGAINQIFTPPGGDQHWDLSNLQATQFWDQIIKDPTTGTYQPALN